MGKNDNQDDDQRELEAYALRLQFSIHQLAMKSTEMAEDEFQTALYAIGVLPGMPEFDEANRARVRFQRKESSSVS
jgi:hypothetical protein